MNAPVPFANNPVVFQLLVKLIEKEESRKEGRREEKGRERKGSEDLCSPRWRALPEWAGAGGPSLRPCLESPSF